MGFNYFYENVIYRDWSRNSSYHTQRRIKIAGLLYLIAIVITGLMGINQLLRGYFEIAIADLVFSTLSASMYFTLRYEKTFKIGLHLSVLLLLSLFTFLVFNISKEQFGIILWFFTLPLYAIIILGLRSGFLYALAGFFVLVFVLTDSYLGDFLHIDFINKEYTIRFLVSYLTIIISAYIYESMRIDYAKKIEGQQEEILQQNEEFVEVNSKLQILNATKDKLFSIVAHDLKNPVGAVKNLTQVLVKNHKTYDEGKMEKLLDSISKATSNTYDLLENLLLWSRSQSGTIKNSPIKVNVNESVAEIINLYKNSAEQKDITLSNKVSKGFFVYTDKDALHTVIRNLVSNAIKFTPKGGEIKLDCSVLDDEKVKLSVSDTGVGIGHEDIDKLFGIEENFSKKGTENEAGTGLGLMLCKDFVERNGGVIGVNSVLGKGTTFYFTSPLYTEDVHGKSQAFPIE